VIQAEGLTKQYGKVVAVHEVSFRVAGGEIFGFLGPNGAGKTTTIRLLAGLLRPTRGTATVAGFDIVAEARSVKQRVGYLAENPYLYPKLTGREFLQFMGGLYGVPAAPLAARVERLLGLFELDGKAGQLVEGYSHGMRQKLALAGTLLHQPKVLLLDEPTSGLDPRSARVVKDLLLGLAQRGHTVLLSTHVLEIAEQMCHRVGIIQRGEIVATGSLAELRGQTRSDGGSLEEIFLQLTGGPEAGDLAAFLGAP